MSFEVIRHFTKNMCILLCYHSLRFFYRNRFINECAGKKNLRSRSLTVSQFHSLRVTNFLEDVENTLKKKSVTDIQNQLQLLQL